jgi:hypothetical protein
MDISLGQKTTTDASMPRKWAFTSNLEDEEHLAPKKFKYDLSPVRDCSSLLKRKSPAATSPEGKEQDTEYIPRATKRQCKPTATSSKPLTRRALRELDQANHTSLGQFRSEEIDSQSSFTYTTRESSSAINAYNARFETELNFRNIFFIEDEAEQCPVDLDAFKSAIFATRENPDPSDADARIVQRRAKGSVNEAAPLQSLLPMYLPVLDIYNGDGDDDLFTIPDQTWDKRVSQQFNSDMDTTLTVPKPDQTIGWSAKMPKHPNYCSQLSPWKGKVIWVA